MKSILISIKPQWCEKIAIGEKTIEVRKSAPKEVPFKAYIYATKPKRFYKCGAVSTSDELLWLANGKVEMGDGFKFWADGDEYQGLNAKVIGEFVCDKVYERKCERMHLMYYSVNMSDDDREYKQIKTCLTPEEEWEYGKGKTLYGLHITDLKIYDKPKDLSEFWTVKCTNKRSGCFGCEIKPNCIKTLTRPPQSYMFVEELK